MKAWQRRKLRAQPRPRPPRVVKHGWPRMDRRKAKKLARKLEKAFARPFVAENCHMPPEVTLYIA